MTVRARRLVSPMPHQMVVEEVDLPDTPPPDGLLLEAAVTAISAGTEVANYRGVTTTRAARPGEPYYPGYSFAGTVLAVGERVTGYRPGDRVAGHAPHASRAITRDTSRVAPIPEGVTFAQAAMTTHGCIAINAVRMAHIQLGDSVVVVGGGLIGQFALQLSRLSGGRPVVSTDFVARRRELASRSGADAALDPADGDTRAALDRLAPGGFSVVFEATGSPAAFNPALKLAGRGGRVVLLGSTRGLVEQFDPYGDVHCKGVVILGAHANTTPTAANLSNPWTEPANRRVIFDLIARRDLDVDVLISHRLRPDDAAAAYADLAASPEEFLGVLIDWRSAPAGGG